MTRMLADPARWVSNSLFVLGSILAASGIVGSGVTARSLTDGSVIAEEGVVVSFGEATQGARILVKVPLRNPGTQAIRILGSLDLCTKVGCVRGASPPIEIKGGQEGYFNVKVSLYAIGDFEIKTSLYTDLPGTPSLPLTIKGYVRPSSEVRPVALGLVPL